MKGRAEQKPPGAGSAGPPRPAIARSISMESKGVNVQAAAVNALVPTWLLLLLLLLQLLLLRRSSLVCMRAGADVPPPPNPSFHPSIQGPEGPTMCQALGWTPGT